MRSTHNPALRFLVILRRDFPMVLALLLLVLVCALGGLTAGCSDVQLRPPSAIDAEAAAMKTTIPYADCYKAQHPTEAQEVDDFYTAWQGRLDKERAAVTPAIQP
jgi:hypothetical protein